MKKNIIFLFSLFFFTHANSQSIKKVYFSTDIKCDNAQYPDWNCNCILDKKLRTIGDLSFQGTHGGSYPAYCSPYYFNCHLTLDAATLADGTKHNAGFIIAYPFKKDYNYNIYTYYAARNNDYGGLPPANPKWPSLSAQLTNNSQPGLQEPCPRGVYVSSTPTSNPYFSDTRHITVRPDICYSYLWYVTEPNQSECKCEVFFDSIRIEELPPDVQIVKSFSSSNAICSTNNYSIEVNGQTWQGNVTWTVTNISPSTGTIVNSSINGNTISLSKVSNGVIKLSASLLSNTSCNNSTLTANTTIEVGSPPVPNSISYNNMVAQSNGPMDVHLSTSSSPPYYWYIDNKLVLTTYSLDGRVSAGSCGNHTLRAEVVNSCGTTSSNTLQYNHGCIQQPRFIISPNPASGIVSIQATTPTATTLKNNTTTNNGTITLVRLMTPLGSVSKEWKFASGNKQSQINVSGLTPGTYYLEISDGVTIERKALIIGNQ